MNINDTLTLEWDAYTHRPDGSIANGFIVYQIEVKDPLSGVFADFTTPDARTSLSFVPANRKFKAGSYSFCYRVIEEVDGQTLKSPFSDPLIITFEEVVKPLKPSLIRIG